MASSRRLGSQWKLYIYSVVRKLKYRLSIETVSNLHMFNPYIESFQSVGNSVPVCWIFIIVLGHNFSIRAPRVATDNIGIDANNLANDLC